jgi:hypothetical protein
METTLLAVSQQRARQQIPVALLSLSFDRHARSPAQSLGMRQLILHARFPIANIVVQSPQAVFK